MLLSAGIAGTMALFAFMPASKAAQTYTVRYSAPIIHYTIATTNTIPTRYTIVRNADGTYSTVISASSNTKPVVQQPATISYPNTSSAPKSPTLPITTATAIEPAPAASKGDHTLTSEEREMVDYINEERVKAGLKALVTDPELANVARLKAQDMRDNNYFSHTSPTYGSPFDMMKQFGLTYRTAGENIAKNSSVLKAHLALMNSEGHKANILNGTFTHVGVGIVDYQGGKIVVEMFIGK
ncbi:CAP domain-containing protein [Mahella sp.]|uniref:CAP domain-containing protein n=1 Tax=Mahella sp. TaxID=2798721 RepID=UPI0025B8803B|nr:CAP domain-containing protein [Mahella sp.]MBZ4666504.1 SCP-like extracellular [Mahella sp.]